MKKTLADYAADEIREMQASPELDLLCAQELNLEARINKLGEVECRKQVRSPWVFWCPSEDGSDMLCVLKGALERIFSKRRWFFRELALLADRKTPPDMPRLSLEGAFVVLRYELPLNIVRAFLLAGMNETVPAENPTKL